MTRSGRCFGAALTLAVLPMLAGAGTCGVIFDTSQRALILDPVARLDFASDSGGLELLAFDRHGFVVQYYLSGFQASLEDVGYRVADDALSVFLLRGGPADISADFYLEVPLGTELSLRAESGPVTLVGLDAPITGTIGEGDLHGSVLAAPSLDLEVTHGEVDLAWATVPDSVRLHVESGDVTLSVPTGSYRCELRSGRDDTATAGITCDPAAAASLVITADDGQIRVEGVTP